MAIESILKQTFKEFEFLIIDDGSTDNSLEIIRFYEDSRIRLVMNEENLGLAASLNRGISLSKGKYIARMDCDDISLPKRLADQVEFMDNHPFVGACGTNGLCIDEDDKIIRTSSWCPEDGVPLEWLLLWDTVLAHPTVMLRKTTLMEHNLAYRNVPAEDKDLWCRLVLKAKIARLPQMLFHYRERRGSSYNGCKDKHVRQAIQSGSGLVRAITHQEVPPFYSELTVYPYIVGYKANSYTPETVVKWILELLQSCRQHWNWNDLEYEAARNDAIMRLNHYFKSLPVWKAVAGLLLVANIDEMPRRNVRLGINVARMLCKKIRLLRSIYSYFKGATV